MIKSEPQNGIHWMKFFSIMGKIMEVRIEQRAKDTIDELKKKDIDMVEKIKLLFKKIQNE